MATKKISKVDGAIRSAITASNGATALIQTACIEILIHASRHGDYTKANDLVTGLDSGVRRDTLIKWLQDFGGFLVEGKEFNGWKGAEHIKEKFAIAKVTPWHTYKKEPNPWAGFNLDESLRNILKQAKLAQKKVKEKPELADKLEISEEHLNLLVSMFAGSASASTAVN